MRVRYNVHYVPTYIMSDPLYGLIYRKRVSERALMSAYLRVYNIIWLRIGVQ